MTSFHELSGCRPSRQGPAAPDGRTDPGKSDTQRRSRTMQGWKTPHRPSAASSAHSLRHDSRSGQGGWNCRPPGTAETSTTPVPAPPVRKRYQKNDYDRRPGRCRGVPVLPFDRKIPAALPEHSGTSPPCGGDGRYKTRRYHRGQRRRAFCRIHCGNQTQRDQAWETSRSRS